MFVRVKVFYFHPMNEKKELKLKKSKVFLASADTEKYEGLVF